MADKGSALMIALGGKPKGESDEGAPMKGSSSAKKALWKAIKGDDYEAFCDAIDLVADERDDSYPDEESEGDED